jgi:hypothetical protein
MKKGLLTQSEYSVPPTLGAPRRTDYLVEGPSWMRAGTTEPDLFALRVLTRLHLSEPRQLRF